MNHHDPRLFELDFLQNISRGKYAEGHLPMQRAHDVYRNLSIHIEPVEFLVEMLIRNFIKLKWDQEHELLVGVVRGDYSGGLLIPHVIRDEYRLNPRKTLQNNLQRNGSAVQFQITWTGLNHIENLRERLKRDRILETHGVLLDMRYYNQELADAIRRDDSTPISVMAMDLDNFKEINENHGHAAGDAMLIAYMNIIKDELKNFGVAMRGTGDEVKVILLGCDDKKCLEIANNIRDRISKFDVLHEGNPLPRRTASIGIATTPPEKRSRDLEKIADDRQRSAKTKGKNQVVNSGS